MLAQDTTISTYLRWYLVNEANEADILLFPRVLNLLQYFKAHFEEKN